MIQTANELTNLVAHIRETLPDPKAILNVKVLERLGAVTFYWHGVEFLVKPSFEVMELRGNNIYITGLSSLLQLILSRKNHNGRIVENMLARINQVEELIQSKEETESAVRVLGSVKQTLTRMLAN
jgi:hypothetical protein